MPTETPTLSEIAQWSVPNRIQLIEEVWNTIAAAPHQLPVTEEQRAELDSRLADYQQNPSSGSSWEEVKRQLTGSA